MCTLRDIYYDFLRLQNIIFFIYKKISTLDFMQNLYILLNTEEFIYLNLS